MKSNEKIELLEIPFIDEGDEKLNDICKKCDSYEICGHCFYVRTILNDNKEKCLLAKHYNFQFEDVIKE